MDILGIDLAKRSFDATLLRSDGSQHHRSFANSPDGFAQLDAWLRERGVERLQACMEATNVYWEDLALWLYQHDCIVSVVNPARIKGYAQATLQRNKTDKLDSAIIASFAAKHQPDAWQPMTAEQQQLRALTRHRDDLMQTKLQQTNRLRDTKDPFVRASLEALVKVITNQIREIERQIRVHTAAQEQIKANLALLTSIVGIGALTASKMMAECGELRRYSSARAVAADMGVTASTYESGTSVRRRAKMSKMGNAVMRAALYMPALTAMRRCPACQAFVERLRRRGKPSKVIIGAVMRKLVHAMYGVLKHQQPYDPAKVFGSVSSST